MVKINIFYFFIVKNKYIQYKYIYFVVHTNETLQTTNSLNRHFSVEHFLGGELVRVRDRYLQNLNVTIT
jgi:hypothetical protein